MAAHSAFAVDLPSYTNVKVCNPAETFCADVDASSRILAHVTQSTSPWVTSAAQAGIWSLRLQDGSGNAIGSTGGALNVYATQGTSPWVTSRTWTLSNGTDSIAAVQSGTWAARLQDGSGNAITSQTSGAQRAVDVGINVAGAQVDPRTRTWNLSSSDVPLVSQGAAAAASGGWPVKLTDGTSTMAVKAASTAPAAIDPAGVVVLSPNGNQATAANQTTEITALQLIDNPVGSVAPGTAGTSSYLAGCVYTAAGVTLTNAQQAACQMTVDGRLKTDGAITSTVGSYVDKGAFIYGTDKFNPTGGIYQDTSASLTAGQVGVSRMTQYRALHVNLRDSSGVEFATPNNPLIIGPANSLGSFQFGDVTLGAIALAKVERTTYTEQSTNAQRSIKSASANDTSAGTGARTIKITYLDQTGAGPFTETITLNGTTCVATVSSTITFIEKIEVITIGSGGSNAGILTFSANNACGGTTIGTVGAGDNQTFWAHHYVPTLKVANITGISVSHNGTTVGSGGVFIVRSVMVPVANQVESQISDFVRLYGQSSTFARSYASPIKVVGPARITVYVTPETSSSTIYRGAIDDYERDQ